MSFAPTNSAVLPTKMASQMTSSAFMLPKVLPNDRKSLKSLLHVLFTQLEAQHAAHATAVDTIHAAHATAVDTIHAAHEATVATIKREADAHVQRLIEQIVLARQRLFGSSSEQLSAQGRLFDEAEVLAQSSTSAQDIAAVPPAAPTTVPVDQVIAQTSAKPMRGKRRPLPTALPRVDVIHDVAQDQRTCPCGTPMIEIGQDISEQLDIVPMRVLRHIRKRYGCPGSTHAPVTQGDLQVIELGIELLL